MSVGFIRSGDMRFVPCEDHSPDMHDPRYAPPLGGQLKNTNHRRIHMFNIGSGGLRRYLTATIAVASVASGLALCTAGTASADETTVEQLYPAIAGGLVQRQLWPMKCPANAQYLKRHNYSPGRLVPNGVEVIENGGIGVTMGTEFGPKIPYPAGGGSKHPALAAVQESTVQFAIGTTGGSATNWGSERGDVIVKLWCTSNMRDASVVEN